MKGKLRELKWLKHLSAFVTAATIAVSFMLSACSPSLSDVSANPAPMSVVNTPVLSATLTQTLTPTSAPTATSTATATLTPTETPTATVVPVETVLSQIGCSTNLTRDGFYLCSLHALDLSKLPAGWTIRVYVWQADRNYTDRQPYAIVQSGSDMITPRTPAMYVSVLQDERVLYEFSLYFPGLVSAPTVQKGQPAEQGQPILPPPPPPQPTTEPGT
ncbi:hypothetical protein BECAL_00619 [Bellilinea caldifistulae]|nr:hypothetical protein BECAL_00619 [Bellilinea caldifistulae]